jgi:hypothetical protein
MLWCGLLTFVGSIVAFSVCSMLYALGETSDTTSSLHTLFLK